jgi:hypothetical protein
MKVRRAGTIGVLALLLAMGGATGGAAVSAQTVARADAERGGRDPRGGVVGSVLDAQTGDPIEGATVVLQPDVVGAFPAGPASGSAFTTSSRAVISGADGTYRFDGLASGVYRVYVSRFGYRPYSISIELRGAAVSPVAIALTAEPIPLQPLRSAGHARGPYESTNAFGTDVGMARLLAADMRRRQFLTTDTRELTHADVVEAVTLGEPDVMRALQRLPGVTTRSDYTAELWTRGAPWSHTRVYFDGIPLFNPLHALGVVSGIGSNAIGAVWFHPGARSAAIGEGSAGIVDLQSRRASGGGELNAHADLSLMSAGLALDQRVLDGRAGWMLSGRQTYLDWLTSLARRASGHDDVSFPYGFSELAGRADVWLGDHTTIEVSGLWERDHLTSAREDASLRAEWGNTAGRVSLNTRAAGVHLRNTAFFSRHEGIVLPDSWRLGQIPQSATVARESDTGVQAVGVTGTIWPEPASLAGPAWSAGYAVERHSVGYYGPQVLPVPRYAAVPESIIGRAADSLRLSWNSSMPLIALWGERNWSAGERLGVRTGLRAETGAEVANSGTVRLAPRLSLRYMPLPELAVSAGYSRVYQYTQSIAPGGLYLASLATTDVWLLAGPHMPALRSDIVTAGAEGWLGPGRALAVNVFARNTSGVATPDPTPGRLHDRPSFVMGVGAARGAEVSVRQITGRVTGSASYSLSRSETSARARTYAAAADRRHVFSATSMVRANPALRLGAAFTAASGVPFTRVVGTLAECAEEPGCDADRLPWIGEPNAARAPTYASLDLLLDWSARVGSFDIGAYAQLRNALGRENATIYTADEPGCMPVGCGGDLRSEYERGVPRLPVLGIRVRH